MQDNQLSQEEISQLTEADWKERLSADEYHVMREKGTERPFTGVYNDATDDGIYRCKGCGASLFDSSNKFDASCGWPSFDQGVDNSAIEEHVDKSAWMSATLTCQPSAFIDKLKTLSVNDPYTGKTVTGGIITITDSKPIQYLVIEKLILYSKDIYFSLMTDLKNFNSRTGVFSKTNITFMKINEICQEYSIKRDRDIYIKECDYYDNPILRHLEENINEFNPPKYTESL